MRRIATLAASLALLVPATALAQAGSTCQTYNPQTCNSISLSTTNDGSKASSSDGTLPFTGLDALLLVVGGGTMIGVGFGVRRLSRRLN
jgi:hypothetical protein